MSSTNLLHLKLPELIDLALASPRIGHALNLQILHTLLHIIVKRAKLDGVPVEFDEKFSNNIEAIMASSEYKTNLTLKEIDRHGNEVGRRVESKSSTLFRVESGMLNADAGKEEDEEEVIESATRVKVSVITDDGPRTSTDSVDYLVEKQTSNTSATGGTEGPVISTDEKPSISSACVVADMHANRTESGGQMESKSQISAGFVKATDEPSVNLSETYDGVSENELSEQPTSSVRLSETPSVPQDTSGASLLRAKKTMCVTEPERSQSTAVPYAIDNTPVSSEDAVTSKIEQANRQPSYKKTSIDNGEEVERKHYVSASKEDIANVSQSGFTSNIFDGIDNKDSSKQQIVVSRLHDRRVSATTIAVPERVEDKSWPARPTSTFNTINLRRSSDIRSDIKVERANDEPSPVSIPDNTDTDHRVPPGIRYDFKYESEKKAFQQALSTPMHDTIIPPRSTDRNNHNIELRFKKIEKVLDILQLQISRTIAGGSSTMLLHNVHCISCDRPSAHKCKDEDRIVKRGVRPSYHKNTVITYN